MEAKDLLLHYDDCVRKEKRLKSEILWTREKIKSLNHIPGRMTRQMKEDVSHIEKKLRIYEEELVSISEERQRIHDLITDIPGIEGEVLKRRYVDGEIWEGICEGIHYSWNGVFKIHDRALQMVQERLDQGLFSL